VIGLRDPNHLRLGGAPNSSGGIRGLTPIFTGSPGFDEAPSQERIQILRGFVYPTVLCV